MKKKTYRQKMENKKKERETFEKKKLN